MLLVYLAADSLSEERLAIEQRPLFPDGAHIAGRPSLGSAEKGEAVLVSLVDSLASILEIPQRDGDQPGSTVVLGGESGLSPQRLW